MKKFKLNSNVKVQLENRDLIFPGIGAGNFNNRTVAFTEAELERLHKIRAKYKISRSAIIRILLNAIPKEWLEIKETK